MFFNCWHPCWRTIKDKKMYNINNEILNFTASLEKNLLLRRAFIKDPHLCLANNGLYLPPSLHIEVIEQQDKDFYFIIPSIDPNLSEMELFHIIAAQTTTTVSSFTTASCLSSISTIFGGCYSTASSASSVATVGSAVTAQSHKGVIRGNFHNK